jgi:PAS domain S-box-containing protein
MHDLLENTKIGVRIAMALFLPIVGLLLFSGMLIIDKRGVVTEMKDLHKLTELVPTISTLVHELQKERGMSAVFLSTDSVEFVKKLADQRALTSTKHDILLQSLKDFDAHAMSANFVAIKGTAIDALKGLKATRAKVTGQTTTVPEMVGDYTTTIAKLLALVEELAVLSSNALITNKIAAYTSLLQAKERAGLERAMGGVGFGAGQFVPPVYRNFLQLIAMQNTFLGFFNTHASDDERDLLLNTVTGRDVAEVERMRTIAIRSHISGSVEGITGPYWFETATKKINLMKTVADHVVENLRVQGNDIRTRTQKYFMVLLVFTFGLLVVTAVIVMIIVRSITEPITLMTVDMLKLAEGDKTLDIHGGHRGDEIGAMAGAVDVFKENMIEAAENEDRYRSITNSSSIAMIVSTDKAGKIISWNPAAEKIFGYSQSEIIDRPITEIMPERYRDAHTKGLQNAANTGEYKVIGSTVELHGLKKNGEEFPLELSLGAWMQGGHNYFSAIIHDTTERVKIDELLRRSQKMEAIGELTGGIAHDFNNLLGIIVGNLDLMSRKVESGSKLQKQLEKAQNAAVRGASLTKRLLSFSRQSIEAHSPVDVGKVVSEFEELIRKSLTASIAVEIHCADDLWMVELNPDDFEDALINLSLNARDAMPKGGNLIIEIKNTILDGRYTNFKDGLEPGQYVEIAVSDAGTGMSKAVADKIFDPFFTTKGKEKGTGLGLAMVYGFVQRTHGHITVYSEVGEGTTFRMYLPRSMSKSKRAENSAGIVASLPEGTETVLIVDDEVELTAVAESILEDLGYTTICAHSGHEAQQALQNNNTIALVFSDVVMPGGISGFDLADVMAKEYPGVKILLTSGFTGKINHSGRSVELSRKILTKPYRDLELATRVRETLDEVG